MNVSLLGSARDFDAAWREAWKLEDLREVLGAVAYVSEAGARLVHECWRGNPAELLLLCGVEEATQSGALARFVQWRGENSDALPRVEFAWIAPVHGRFHPKFWLFTSARECQLFIGSSNLTAGGHQGNIEAGVLLKFEVATEFELVARQIFADWWRDSHSLQQRLIESAEWRDNERADAKNSTGTDSISARWNEEVQQETIAEPKSAPLTATPFGVEQRVVALLRQGIIVELTVSARKLYEKFEGNPFDISGSQKEVTEVLQIDRRDSQKFCVLCAETKRRLDNSQNGARTTLNLYAYKSPWGNFVPHDVFLQWHEKQGGKRAKFKLEIEQQFQSEAFWRDERDRLRRQIEKDSIEIWSKLHPNRPKMPQKNFKQVIYEVQRAFDRRHCELRDSVDLHYQTRPASWGDSSHEIQNAPPEVTLLLQSHAHNQRELLLRDWMKCLIQTTRKSAGQIIKDMGEGKNSASADAQRLGKMNFFGDVYVRDFVLFVHGPSAPSLFAETEEQFAKASGEDEWTLGSWKQHFEADLEVLNSWRDGSFAEVLTSFAKVTGWQDIL